MGSVCYQDVLQDLLILNEGHTVGYIPPYSDSMELEEKFNVTLRALFHAKQLQNWSLQLFCAYFLGKILEEEADPLSKQAYYAQRLMTYYRITSVWAYFLFKPFGPTKIMNLARTSLTTLRNLSTEEFQDLVTKSSLIFNGVENWEGSDVVSDYVTSLINVTDVINE
ncbi:hypothetical protein GLOIN_2v1780851 [Rhizophagus clarus]|uniref:Uncharacterized protein n=1 Tax=Rhizophagus clarus TaxID=94130 RepID=A0A8H3MCI7_9GLOM|nr:hypothetical protein GLOIN_2v1780851 [Rhizophagus clarus]